MMNNNVDKLGCARISNNIIQSSKHVEAILIHPKQNKVLQARFMMLIFMVITHKNQKR